MTVTATAVLDALEIHKNVLLLGPPGTGKSHLMREVQNLFESKYSGKAGARIFIETAKERQAITAKEALVGPSSWVTFHQGYSYEDFVIGLRPKQGAGSALTLEARPGALLQLAGHTGSGRGLLLIDEINRGNTSRIFGEFITLMEEDKRLLEDGSVGPMTVTVSLPYILPEEPITLENGVEIAREFRMPRRLYTLASMNSVDKSTAPIDAAIRRRFHIITLAPTRGDLEVSAGVAEATHGVAKLAVDLVERINVGIGHYLGPDFMLGQYYLPSRTTLGAMEESEAKKALVDTWHHRMLPHLVELFQGRIEALLSTLRLRGAKQKDIAGLVVFMPEPEQSDDGAMPFVRIANVADTEEVFAYLKDLACAKETPASTESPGTQSLGVEPAATA